MARRKTKRQYLKELDRLEPSIRRSYLKWVAGRIGATSVRRVEQMVRTGDVEALIGTLDIGASLGEFNESVRETYKAGAAFEAPAAAVTFNIRSRGAEDWIGANSTNKIEDISNNVRANLQTALRTGIEKGTNPKVTALDILGRRGTTGRRTGGVIGLNGPQGAALDSARKQLRSGDPDELRKYLTRTRRDKRYDAQVKAAIKSGRPLTAAQVNKISGRYSERLLKLRAETIARTESTRAFNAAREESWDQAIESGKIEDRFVKGRWSATMDNSTRYSHEKLNGQERPHGVPFHSITGAKMLYPGDTSQGAGPEDVVNCRCFLEKTADFIAQEAARQKGL